VLGYLNPTGFGRSGLRLDRAAAERVVTATLATLAERVGQQEFAPLAARLPDKLRRRPAAADNQPAPFPPEEFVRRVARRAETDQASTWAQTRAVLATLRQSLIEVEQVRQRLQGYDSLMT
jgi:uncharacterized protein (DUF2267 family)